MSWKELEQGRAFMNEEYDQDDLERAYRRGCEHGEEKGYRKAMREMQEWTDTVNVADTVATVSVGNPSCAATVSETASTEATATANAVESSTQGATRVTGR